MAADCKGEPEPRIWQVMRHAGDPLAGAFKHSDNFIGRHDSDGSRTAISKPSPRGDAYRDFEQRVALGTRLIGATKREQAATTS